MIDSIPRRPWLVLAALCIAVFLVVVDNTIVNVALPTFSIKLNASNTVLQWIVDGYALPFAGLLVAGGEVADRWGRKRVMQIALVAFAVFSFLAAESQSTLQLLIARALMGAAAAFIFPATLSLVTTTFTDPRERTKAFGFWGATVGIAIALGPIMGGYLIDHFWYGSVFFVNVPIVLVTLVATSVVVPESRSPEQRPLDFGGLVLGVVGVTVLTLAIIDGPSWGWRAPATIALFATALAAFVWFVRFERSRDAPMLDVRIFRNREFSAAAASVATSFFCLFGFVFLTTQYFQLVRGYSPLSAGVHTLPFAVVVAVMTPLGALATIHVGARFVVSAGLMIMGLSLWWMAHFGPMAPFVGPVVLSMMTLALGFSLISSPSTASLMNTLSTNQVGAGASLNETTREIGGTLGVAVVGSVFSSVFGPQLRAALSPLGFSSSVINRAITSMQAAEQLVHRVPAGVGRVAAGHAVINAFMDGFHRGCLVAAALTGTLSLVVFWFLPGPVPANVVGASPVETH